MIQNTDVLPKNIHTLYFPNYTWQDQVFEPLLRYDWRAGLKPTPALAESWELSPDAKTLTFKLRRGVRYHSGREFGSEDVKFNLLRVREERVGSQWRAYSNDIDEIQTPDPTTVVLRLKESRPGALDMFDLLLMADRETIDDLETGKQVVGTGPFKWVRWSPNDQLVMTRNQDYWRPGAPQLDEITVRILPDAQAVSLNLESGAADFVIAPAFSDLPRLRQNSTLAVESSINGNWHFYLGADLLQPPLDNPKLRQALNWAIDRQRIVDAVFFGAAQPVSVAWGPSNPAWNDDQANAYTYNLDKARALLAEAGASAGFETTLTINTALEPMRGMAQIIQSDLAKLGVRVRLQELEPNRWLELLVGRNFRGLWIGPTGSGNFHPGSLVSLLFPFRAQNASNFESPRYTELANRARVETDPQRAKTVYRDLTQLMLDESFVMPFVIQRSSFALSSKVKGWDYTAQETVLFGGASLSG